MNKRKKLLVLANTKTRSAVTVLRDGIVTHYTRLARIICFRCIQCSVEVKYYKILYFFEFYDVLVNIETFTYIKVKIIRSGISKNDSLDFKDIKEFLANALYI